MDLSEKQQQFNAAMARYNGGNGYILFGRLVAAVNIALQAYLLYRVWPFAIGIPRQVFAILTAWVLTDFINGLVHIYMDNNDHYESLTGPLVANFHLHHKTPRYIKHNLLVVYFNETGSKIWLIGYLVAVALLLTAGINPVAATILVYIGVLSSAAEVSHYLCHSSMAKAAVFLGNAGILLAKRHHARHHLQDNASYAFLNGWTDPLLDLIAARIYKKGYKQTTDLHYGQYAAADAEERF
jgi:Lipid desaturase domain